MALWLLKARTAGTSMFNDDSGCQEVLAIGHCNFRFMSLLVRSSPHVQGVVRCDH